MRTSRSRETVVPRHLRQSRGGFTLLELVLAVSMLATFVLPVLYIIANARTSTTRMTIARQVRGLAQAKLHDRMHYYELENQGTFEDAGRPDWVWEITEPQMRTQSEQIVLSYTIRVQIPQRLDEDSPAGEGTLYEYSMWTFPDENWYEEQQLLYDSGQYSPLYGDPTLGTPGAAGAAGAAGLGGSW